MADLVQTAANVASGLADTTLSASNVKKVIWGETVAQGNAVRYNELDKRYYKAKNDTVDHADAKGVALSGGAAGQPGYVQQSGDINLGATLVVGATYCVSDTAGAICPDADIGSGEFKTVLGVADAANNLKLDILASGIAHA